MTSDTLQFNRRLPKRAVAAIRVLSEMYGTSETGAVESAVEDALIFAVGALSGKIRAAVYSSNMKAKHLDRTASLTEEQWRAVLVASGGVCAVCKERIGIYLLTLDHIQALSVGGSSHAGNVQPACLSCNSIKGVNIASEIEGLVTIKELAKAAGVCTGSVRQHIKLGYLPAFQTTHGSWRIKPEAAAAYVRYQQQTNARLGVPYEPPPPIEKPVFEALYQVLPYWAYLVSGEQVFVARLNVEFVKYHLAQKGLTANVIGDDKFYEREKTANRELGRALANFEASDGDDLRMPSCFTDMY